MSDTPYKLRTAWQRHERRWEGNLYVYPVVSRRSGGLSIGINLNPDKGCSFDCIYCQVDRTIPPAVRKVDLARVAAELDAILGAARDGSLYDVPPCGDLPPEGRAIRDIAFSGDGEPTAYPRFREAVEIAASARRRFGLNDTKIVLITDAAHLAKPGVRQALAVMDGNNGEVWAKLDAGTEEYFRRVNRPNASLDHVLAAVLDAARARPIVIQTLFFRIDGETPAESEVDAYATRLTGLLEAGGQLKAIQLHTIARKPAQPSAEPLSNREIDAIADRLRRLVPVPVEVYYCISAQ